VSEFDAAGKGWGEQLAADRAREIEYRPGSTLSGSEGEELHPMLMMAAANEPASQ
jgi:hypothetical protein